MSETTNYNELLDKMKKCLIESNSYLIENSTPWAQSIQNNRDIAIPGVYTKVAFAFSTIMTKNCTSYAQHKSIEQFKKILEQSLILLIGVLVTDRQYKKRIITIESIVDLFNDFRKVELKPADNIADAYIRVDPYALVTINELLKTNRHDEAIQILHEFVIKVFQVLITPGDLLDMLQKKRLAAQL